MVAIAREALNHGDGMVLVLTLWCWSKDQGPKFGGLTPGFPNIWLGCLVLRVSLIATRSWWVLALSLGVILLDGRFRSQSWLSFQPCFLPFAGQNR